MGTFFNTSLYNSVSYDQLHSHKAKLRAFISLSLAEDQIKSNCYWWQKASAQFGSLILAYQDTPDASKTTPSVLGKDPDAGKD